MKYLGSVGYSNWDPRISIELYPQSSNIAAAASIGFSGDQGIVYGYACNETRDLLPSSVVKAHAIVSYLADRQGVGPDGKAQVTPGDNTYVSVHSTPGTDRQVLEAELKYFAEGDLRVVYFEQGGPQADTGLTGRKLQVDTYGTACSHGGGALSGKDCTKMDRTGAYLARAVARWLLKRGGLEWAEVGLAYGFDQRSPLWVRVRSNEPEEDERLTRMTLSQWDLSIEAAIERFSLYRPIYRNTSTFGHFKLGYPWEI